MTRLRHALNGKSLLLAVAAPSEIRAAFGALGSAQSTEPPPWTLIHVREGVDLVHTGVGKANAAGAVARTLDPSRHAAVLSIGIGGALPCGPSTRAIRDVVIATACAYADEGVQTPAGFTDIGSRGFPPTPDFIGGAIATTPWMRDAMLPLSGPGWSATTGIIATVSTCSGTDALAQDVARRIGAAVEAMEGAAVAQAASRLGIACGEVRIVSNTTGDHQKQVWDLRGAFDRLAEVLGHLIG